MFSKPLPLLSKSLFSLLPQLPVASLALTTPLLRNSMKRYFASNAKLDYIPHAFSYEEAAKKIAEADKKRLFAPKNLEINKKVSGVSSSLKKVLLPLYGINAYIQQTSYQASYGIEKRYTTTDSKGNTKTHLKTEWFPISGTLGSYRYTPEDLEMLMYGGLTWHAKTVEKALEGRHFIPALKAYDPKQIESNIFIDPFVKRLALGQEDADKRLKEAEKARIKAEIRRRVYYDYLLIYKSVVQYNQFSLSSYLLPAFILQYEASTARVLPALSASNNKVYGSAPISVGKSMAVSMALSTLLSFTSPYTIPFKLALALGPSLLTGLWGKYHLGIQYKVQQMMLDREKARNEAVSPTLADDARLEATLKEAIKEAPKVYEKKSEEALNNYAAINKNLKVSAAYYTLLGIDSKKMITESLVKEAFFKQIKQHHPDHGGNLERSQQLIQARKVFLEALIKSSAHKNESGKQHFSTYNKSKGTALPPRSIHDPNARELINAVLDKKYDRALEMVKNGEVHPDGHDKHENTLLTEATKKGALDAVSFAVKTLRASVDTSCDCPHHNTALHYAVRIGSEDIVKFLLDAKANPNLINSLGETARDIAKAKNLTKIENLLKERGAVLHKNAEGVSIFTTVKSRLFGYNLNERTLLSEEDKTKFFPKK